MWTWTAICADTRLLTAWRIGDRTRVTAIPFFEDLRKRIGGRVQITSDGHTAYMEAVDQVFGSDVDFAMLIKVLNKGLHRGGADHRERRPDLDLISTSYVERSNPTVRMSQKRYTRKTNAFSKKLERLIASFAMWSLWYNFGRKHLTLKRIPAEAAGVARLQWTPLDVVDLIDERTPAPGLAGAARAYRKRGDVV